MRSRRAALVAGSIALAIALGSGPLGPAPLAPARAQDAPPSPVVDFSLEETSGQTRTMAAVRGRVVVVFYEDRDHSELNTAFKQTLHRFVLDNHLQPQVTTYAVANVHGVDGVVRDLARGAIRAVASRYGIQILLDWEGALQRAPWSLAPRDANVVLVDRAGRIRWRHTGAITESDRAAFFRTLRGLLRETAPGAPPQPERVPPIPG